MFLLFQTLIVAFTLQIANIAFNSLNTKNSKVWHKSLTEATIAVHLFMCLFFPPCSENDLASAPASQLALFLHPYLAKSVSHLFKRPLLKQCQHCFPSNDHVLFRSRRKQLSIDPQLKGFHV